MFCCMRVCYGLTKTPWIYQKRMDKYWKSIINRNNLNLSEIRIDILNWHRKNIRNPNRPSQLKTFTQPAKSSQCFFSCYVFIYIWIIVPFEEKFLYSLPFCHKIETNKVHWRHFFRSHYRFILAVTMKIQLSMIDFSIEYLCEFRNKINGENGGNRELCRIFYFFQIFIHFSAFKAMFSKDKNRLKFDTTFRFQKGLFTKKKKNASGRLKRKSFWIKTR